MKAFRYVFQLGLLIGLGIVILDLRAAAQTTPPKEAQPVAPGLSKLSGDDANKAEELDKSIDAALKDDHWDDAIARAEELIALRTRVQGPKHFETVNAEWRQRMLRRMTKMPHENRLAYLAANTMDEQAETLSSQGKYAQAQPLLEKALEIRRRCLTDEHPTTAASLDSLALNLGNQAKYAAAQTLFERTLEVRRLLLTDEHPDTADSYLNLADNLRRQGKYAQAQPLFEKALEIFRRLLTDEHSLTASSYSNLGLNFDAQGKHAQAQTLYEKALEIRRRVLTDDHIDTATSYSNLAVNLSTQGKYAQAQALYEKALEIYRRRLTDEHPYTATSYNNVASNLTLQGKYAQAQTLFEKSLEIRRRLLTDEHPDTAQSYNNLAYNLRIQGEYAQAQTLFEKALKIFRHLLTDEHPDTANGFNNLATSLNSQGKHAQAQPLYEKALEINRRLLTEEHPRTAISYNNVALNRDAQGKYTQAQPLYEKALEIYRRLLTDEHSTTAFGYHSVAQNLNAQGKYLEARDQWLNAVKSLDKARLRVAFTGLERMGTVKSMRPAVAAVLARLGQPAEAWQTLEEDLGRGLLDELAARQDRRLAPPERARLRELTVALERLDRLVETTPEDLDKAERAKRFAEVRRQRELASIALGEFQTKLVHDYGPLAGEVASLNEIQTALAADAALVAWVDIPPAGPNAADPDGEHWGVVVRSSGFPSWIPIAGTGPDKLWTDHDTAVAGRVRMALRRLPAASSAELQPLVQELRIQRLEPLRTALFDSAGGQPPARRLIVLPSRAMVGIPVEALLAADDARTVSYAPSATVLKYLREQPRPDRHAGLLALGDPVYERPDKSSESKPLPDHGLLVNVVTPGSNAATHGLKPDDVLLAYNGKVLNKMDDLKEIAGGEPIGVEVWNDGRMLRRELAPGKLGVVFDARPAPEAIAANRAIKKVLLAARSGDKDFAPLPGTRYEVEALARLFHSDDRRTRILLGTDGSEQELDRLAAAGELVRFGFIHLATHGVIDEGLPVRSAVILNQTGLPDPLEQALHHKPAYDGRLSVREIQRGWELKAELVTLSACETALGREAGGEGFVGFTQALLMSGARSVCLSLWKVDDTATALLMKRFYANLLGRRPGLNGPMPKAEALREAKTWLRGLGRADLLALTADMPGGSVRGKNAEARQPAEPDTAGSAGRADDRPYVSPHFWAAFVLSGDPD